MRIDLEHGRRRPWPLRLALWVVRRKTGMVPGPTLALTYRLDLFSRRLRGYILRGMRGDSAWSKGEAELLAAFVSKLNTCHF